MTETHPRLQALDARIKTGWKAFASRPELGAIVASGALMDRRALAMYLVQAYHTTWHTSRNQALVGVNRSNVDLSYMKYCFRHALEEVGHEQMALHDLRGLGLVFVEPQRDLPPPLPATEQLLAWLYWVGTQGNPVARLGYSFWAERAYPYGDGYIDMIRQGMRLDASQVTFFTVHATIDERHGAEVAEALVDACHTEADWSAVERTLDVTMRLTFEQILEEWAAFQVLLGDGPSAYAALRAIPA